MLLLLPGQDTGVLPDLPEGTPPWVYAVVAGAVVIVTLVGKGPAIIDGLNKLLGRETKPPAPAPTPAIPSPPPPGPQERAVADKDGVIEWLQEQVEGANRANQELQTQMTSMNDVRIDQAVRITQLTAELDQARAENAVLRQMGGGYRGGGY